MLLRTTVFVPLLLAAWIPAQSSTWKVPPGGLVQWQVEGRLTFGEGRGEVPVGSGATRCEPVLFHAEVDPSGRRPRTEAWSLSALGPWLAFDLDWRSGSFERTLSRVDPFGSLTVRGEVERLPDGRERLVAKVERIDLVPFDDDEDFLRIEEHYLRSRLDGTATITRRVDAEQGLVAEVDWTFEGHATRWNGREQAPVAVHGGERWSRPRVLARDFAARDQQPSFADWVEEGRRRTIAQVEKRLRERSETSLADEEGNGNVQGPSLHALMLYALARAGARAAEPEVGEQLRQLHERTLTVPSGLAFAILATGWLHAPADERARRATGIGPTPRKLPPALRKAVAGLAKRLVGMARSGHGVSGADARGEPAGGELYWPAGEDMDYFVAFQTFAAVCALDEAIACGVDVDDAMFAGAAAQLLAVRVADDVGSAWGDRGERRRGEANGAATACALAALAICDRRLPKRHALHARIRAAVGEGLAWLDAHPFARFAPAQMVVHRSESDFVLARSVAADELAMDRRRGKDGRDLAFELAFLQRLREEDSGRTGSSVLGMPAALCLWPGAAAAPVAPVTGPR